MEGIDVKVNIISSGRESKDSCDMLQTGPLIRRLEGRGLEGRVYCNMTCIKVQVGCRKIRFWENQASRRTGRKCGEAGATAAAD
jgi:hypothetical protein